MSARLVEITLVTVNTAQIRTAGAARLLDVAGVAKQYDAKAGCWLTSARTLPVLLAYLRQRSRLYVVIEQLQAAS